MLANTIWSPLIIYHYGTFAVWFAIVLGFAIEFFTVWFYIRQSSPFRPTLRAVALANLLSYLAGHVLFIFLPYDLRKDSLRDLTVVFGIAFLASLVVEWFFLSRRLRANRGRLLQGVLFGNFYSYAVLFTGFLLWWFGPSHLFGAATESG